MCTSPYSLFLALACLLLVSPSALAVTPVQAFEIEGSIDVAATTRCYALNGVAVTHHLSTQNLTFRCEGRTWSCRRSTARYQVSTRKFTFSCQSIASESAQTRLTLYPAAQAVAPGGTVQMEVLVQNQGTTAIQNVSVVVPEAPSCARTWASIGAGATVSALCTKANVNVPTEVVATLAATRSGQGITVQTRGHILLSGPRITVELTPNVQAVEAGRTAPLRVTVANTGTVALTNLAAVDSLYSACSGQQSGSTSPGDGFSFNCSLGPFLTGPYQGRIDAVGNATAGTQLRSAGYTVNVTNSLTIHANGFE